MVEGMTEVMARVGYWLADRQGDNQEASSNALLMLGALQQEATKLQMEQQLRPSSAISTTQPQIMPKI